MFVILRTVYDLHSVRNPAEKEQVNDFSGGIGAVVFGDVFHFFAVRSVFLGTRLAYERGAVGDNGKRKLLDRKIHAAGVLIVFAVVGVKNDLPPGVRKVKHHAGIVGDQAVGGGENLVCLKIRREGNDTPEPGEVNASGGEVMELCDNDRIFLFGTVQRLKRFGEHFVVIILFVVVCAVAVGGHIHDDALSVKP